MRNKLNKKSINSIWSSLNNTKKINKTKKKNKKKKINLYFLKMDSNTNNYDTTLSTNQNPLIPNFQNINYIHIKINLKINN